MAKVTITFEDIDEGVRVNVESEPGFPGPANQEEAEFTDAQQMGLRMVDLLNDEVASQNHDHDHDEHCTHEHCHGHGHDEQVTLEKRLDYKNSEVSSDGTPSLQSNE